MPHSIRLDRELQMRLRKRAEREGVSFSEILRRAAALYLEGGGEASLERRLEDVLGAVKSKGGRARRTGQSFRRALQRRR
jgi:predicted DNA-binding protein